VADAGLSWLNLFVSDMLTGFGPFVPVRLAAAGWTPAMIGVALSASTFASVLTQVPAGALCDGLTDRRSIAGGAIVAIMAAALLIGVMPGFIPVLTAEVVQGAASVVLTLSIAGITLRLTEHDRLGERFGNNLRFAAIGGAIGAGLLGLVGAHVSQIAVFGLAAGFGVLALLALRSIRPADLAKAPLRTGHRAVRPAHMREPQRSRRQLLTDGRLLTLMLCVALFSLANADMLPLAASALVKRHGGIADLVVSGAVIISQLLTAAASPWIGRLAQRMGRRPMLLVGIAMLPLRALLFAFDGGPAGTLVAQALDGVTGATFGVLIPLMVSDITHAGGRFTLALGMVGLASSIGASVSTYAGGNIATYMGLPVAFLCLGAVGLAAVLLVWLALPETMHLSATPPLREHELAPT
jgi:MFS family permease